VLKESVNVSELTSMLSHNEISERASYEAVLSRGAFLFFLRRSVDCLPVV